MNESRGQNELAIRDFTKAVEQNPHYYKAYLARGEVYGKLKQYKLAINDYNQVLELDINNFKALSGRGRIYEMGKNMIWI